MKAVRWHGADDVRVDDVPEPEGPGPDDVVIEVDLASICASDVAEWRSGPYVIPVKRPHRLTGKMAPVTLGHEYVGRICALGASVKDLNLGDRVCGDACLRCGACYWCLRGEYNICEQGGSVGFHLDGAFARYLRVPSYAVYRVPDEVSDREAAIVEPLAVALHGLQQANFTAGDSVTVVGFGMIGASATIAALSLGASQVVVVEPNLRRAELAVELGARSAVDPSGDTVRDVRQHTDGRGSDVVIECTGRADTLAPAVEMARRGGRIVLCGLSHQPSQLQTDRLVYFEREIVGALGYRYDHPTVIGLLAAQRLDVSKLFAPSIALDNVVNDGFVAMVDDPDVAHRIPVRIDASSGASVDV
jgi:(R,R)-butanediol dehydrogenase / meso-butanediol dehydrogenase / diacetyl reductase